MTPEVAMYVMSALLVPALAWAIGMQWQLLVVRRELQELLDMHKNPDNTGFGTRQLESLVRENITVIGVLTNAVNEQTAYFKGVAKGRDTT